jgi:hypothetical protein
VTIDEVQLLRSIQPEIEFMLGMVVHIHNPSTEKAERQEDHQCKVSLGCIVSSRPAWTTQQDPVSNKETKDNWFMM